jgi:hypothetical protein
MAEGKLTLWKLQVLVAVFAVRFALCFWLLGSAVGLVVIIMSLPLWSVAFWSMVSERRGPFNDRHIGFICPFPFVVPG